MRQPILAGLCALVAGLSVAGAQQPARQGSAYYTAEQLAAIERMATVDESNRVKAEEIDALFSKGNILLLDVREPREIEALGTIEGAVNIPILQLEGRLSELPRDRAILAA